MQCPESSRLEKIARNSLYAAGMSMYTIIYSAEVFKRFMRRGNVLELGPAEGVMTEILYPEFRHDYTVVDGAQVFIDSIRSRFPEAHAHVSLFEDFNPGSKLFDNIILGHVLEHVEDPVDILRRCSAWLSQGGRILSAVPNSGSIHRQAAVLMGLLDSVESFSEKDRHHGHRRVFNRENFANSFTEAGLTIVESGGYWLKPLSDRQLEESWTEDMINAFFKLGERYPDIAGEIYIVAEKQDNVA